ncbi:MULTISPECIES: AMP-binding protein [Kitasatospora]|uniref:AMP-dependent synthetase/ligase domain-containing protein n=1 Tax=Kitasatospora setae (strain ATCC 33774 / DSM 43861 / JCM 3304 / KCC A-0304 / NBRC 14216 / KM-6054) TaxID=452652 RepID=E4N7F2_KITSK|nr:MULTISPECIES: AMP-binding protein [Kitasatospora]BAJ27133.1 hypothetical protein KSE_13030 [Kitasatospora setae KM-6054]
MGNLATNLQDTAGQYPLRPALRSDGELLSYADLDEFSGRVAGGLRAHGVRAGDRVALALAPGTALPVLLYGVLRLGAVAVLLPGGRAGTGAHGAEVLFATGRGEGQEEDGDVAVRIAVGPDFLDQLAFWPLRAEVVYRADDDPAVLHHATGPGAPVAHDHGTLRARAYADATAGAGIEPGDVVRGCCPPEAAAGGPCGLHATVLAGACLVLDGPTARPCPCSARER